jgi:hypothetical protein
MLADTVNPSHIAKVISRQTGVFLCLCVCCFTTVPVSDVTVKNVFTPASLAPIGSFCRYPGIPIESLLSSESQKLLAMEDQLNKRVIGQKEAVNVISNCVRLARAGLHSHKRPLGVFLFLGPTGASAAPK